MSMNPTNDTAERPRFRFQNLDSIYTKMNSNVQITVEENEPLLDRPIKKLSPFTICIPVFFHVLFLTMCVGVLQQWMLLYLCRYIPAVPDTDGVGYAFKHTFLAGIFNTFPILQTSPNWDQCRVDPDIQALAAQWSMVLQIFSGIPALISVPIYGYLSDRYGRKPILLISMISSVITVTTLYCISLFNLGLWLLILTNFISGCMGSYFIMIGTTLAYFSDTTEPHERSKSFIFGEAAFFAGFAFGPLLGGFGARNLPNGPQDVFLITLILDLFVVLYTIVFLPESLNHLKNNQNHDQTVTDTDVDEKPSNSSILTLTSQILSQTKELFVKASISRTFLLLLAIVLCLPLATSSKSLFFFYVSFKFGWDSQDEGQYGFFTSICVITCMLIVYPILLRVFEKHISTTKGKIKFDLNLIRVGLSFSTITTLIQALASKGLYFYFTTPLIGFATLISPNLKSLLSNSVESKSQGLLFSSISFLEQLLGIVCVIFYSNLWKWTLKIHFENLFFFIAVFIFMTALTISCFTKSTDLNSWIEKVKLENGSFDYEEEIVVMEP